MNKRENSVKPNFYDVAPAHDADTVQTAPARETAPPVVSDAAVAEIKANADEAVASRARELLGKSNTDEAVALRARELRGEEFDFDLNGENGELETVEGKPKPSYIWAWLLLGLALLICVYTFGAVNGQKSRQPLPVGPFSAPSGKPMTVKVQVAGEVNRPGVYELPFNARVLDAIRKAGGPKKLADLSAINLADWAQDGSKIQVPSRATPTPAPTPTIIIREIPAPATAATAPVASGTASNSSAPNSSAATPGGVPFAKTESGATSANASANYLKANPVDLNKATQSELEVLPGVGPKMAERILAYRAENGGFKSVDELDDVKGIGEKRMATLKSLVKVR